MAEYPNDATLLERFVRLREEDAFVVLVRRHGPAVLAVCRRFLRNEHDVEDVFQSTFLVLAQKAPRIPWQESVEGWLRDVARRLALHARVGVARRHVYERSIGAYAADDSGCQTCEMFGDQLRFDPADQAEQGDLRRAVRDALDQLPEKYRVPVVLCYLEGKSNEEAARQLGWPTGSMSRRLERGRTLLRQRLARNGLSLALILCLTFTALNGLRSLTESLLSRRDPMRPIREVMGPFRPQKQNSEGLESILSRLASGNADSFDHDRAGEVATLAASTAIAIEDFDPGRDRDVWRASSAEMRRSALALAQSARSGDRLALASAARRLDATCVRCHACFRPLSFSERPMDDPEVWSSARLPDRMN